MIRNDAHDASVSCSCCQVRGTGLNVSNPPFYEGGGDGRVEREGNLLFTTVSV